MLNYILSYITLAVLFILQTTVSRFIDIADIAPNLIFVYIVCYSIYNFPVRSAILCVIAGVITDLYTTGSIGLNTLFYMYSGLAISIFAGTLIKKNLFAVITGVFVASVVYHITLLLVAYVIPSYSTFAYPFIRYVLPTAVYDAAVSVVLSMWAKNLSEEKIRGL